MTANVYQPLHDTALRYLLDDLCCIRYSAIAEKNARKHVHLVLHTHSTHVRNVSLLHVK